MIHIRIRGGLGNQMFQYATARRLSHKYNTDLALNTEYFYNTPKKDVKRKYQLDVFNIDKNIKTETKVSPIIKLIQKIFLKFFGEKIQISIANLILKIKLPIYLNGYFQNEKYFSDIREEILLKEFTLNKEINEETKKIKEIILKSEAICLNVRRGDYLRPDYLKIYGICSMEYYTKALEYIKQRVENPLICIFSDDPEWVKKEFKIDNVLFTDNRTISDYEQMYLMSLCKHNIMANSSFSWWGAWLNQNPKKIVIGPKQWLVSKSSDELDIMPKDWIKM
jgi:hypothetical protein